MDVDVTVNSSGSNPTTTPGNAPQSNLILLVFIHGFKGTDDTFAGFPDRLRHILAETLKDVVVESIVFPAYEVRPCLLTAAVTQFADWLTNLTVQRENANGSGGGAGKAKVVLCGHSMGGLLMADALVEFVSTRPDRKAPLWPDIIACLAFDTPYLGLHPFVFKNGATQAIGYVREAHGLLSGFQKFGPAAAVPPPIATPSAQASTSIWQKWAPAAYAVGGALIAGAAAGTAYYKRDELSVGYKWATDHMQFVGALWDQRAMQRRVQALLDIEAEVGVLFRTFHTFLPPSPPTYPTSRTFIVLPKTSSRLAEHFVQAPNTLAMDEVQAHTGMFDGKTNDGYYELGLLVAQAIRDAVLVGRGSIDISHPTSFAVESATGPIVQDPHADQVIQEDAASSESA
ncbi:hypothetical protein B0H21DRAFT_842833, partial [Amylocystis lapponica]